MRPVLSSFMLLLLILLTTRSVLAQDIPPAWSEEFPKTDFSRMAVPVTEILSGGPPRDGIPPIDDPVFKPAADINHLAGREPVIRLELGGEIRAYPLSVMTWHEIVNDVVGGVPVAVTYCPLCNAAIAFHRRLPDGTLLDFGTTGRLRNSDLLMYDRQEENWWQQYSGEALIGKRMGQQLDMLPLRMESFADFKAQNPDGPVLVPNNPRLRPYGRNPYRGYDSEARPFLYFGDYDLPVPMMARLVVVDDEAWQLCVLAQQGEIRAGDLVLRWQGGMASALDNPEIAKGRDIGAVQVLRQSKQGALEAVLHHITFAFVFNAFAPDGRLYGDGDSCSSG